MFEHVYSLILCSDVEAWLRREGVDECCIPSCEEENGHLSLDSWREFVSLYGGIVGPLSQGCNA